ncbi:MAG: heme lyase CcmF/NrfE family subunit [Dehalococcoidales bacterium]|nr:heme lyase CcmF/NrfE family subunit [Dehalococcoidales bacterium]
MAIFGYLLLVVALIVSVFTVIAYLLGEHQKNRGLISTGRIGAIAAFALTTLSFGVLAVALLTHHFEIAYVAEHTNLALPVSYLVSALWAGNEGSLFFWCWVLAFCSGLVVLQARKGERELVNYASMVLSILMTFFLLLLIVVVNPFKTQVAPADGAGLNPLLQNPAMIIHPPLLLAGYAIFAVPFAFGIAALITRRLDDLWLNKARSWAILSWLALGLGNLIGAWWAYVELGWGGYWAWDPVENAGLMPWLVATAFLHSMIMQKRRGMFRVWTMSLAILTFWLTIFGTFLTRSNLLKSVHTFGTTGIEPYFGTLLFLIVASGIWLIATRSHELENKNEIENIISRDSSFLLNNLLLVLSTLVIFLGTMFPAFARWFGQPDNSVGKEFFNVVNTPIFIAIVLLAGLCVLLGWRKVNLKDFNRRMLPPLIFSVLLVVILFIAGFRAWYALLAFLFCFFVVFATIWQWFSDLSRRKANGEEETPVPSRSKFWASKNRYGAYTVHIAIALISIGIIGSSLFDTDQTAVLKPGESTQIKGYNLTYNNMDITQPTKDSMLVVVNIGVTKNGASLGQLHPQQTYYTTQEQPVSEVAIRTNPAEDLYIILSAWDESQTVNLHILVNPLVMWIWIGSGILLLGGLICFYPQPLNSLQMTTNPAQKTIEPFAKNAANSPENPRQQTAGKR